MANWLQSQIQNIVSWAFSGAMVDETEAESARRQQALALLMAYYQGDQRRPLKVSLLGKDYNTIINLTKIVVNRSVGMLFGAGMEFDLPGSGDETAQDELIQTTWDANKKDTLLTDLGQFGAIYGTAFIKIVPNGRVYRTGQLVPRLIALNPFQMSIQTNPQDLDDILRYVQRWNDGDTAYREITEKVTASDGSISWQVYREKSDDSTRGRWERITEPVAWPWEFAPIAHAKNLPMAGHVYGLSDVEDVVMLQDRYNEAQSNTNKILALQAWAQKYVIGDKWPTVTDGKGNTYTDIGPDKALQFGNPEAKVGILAPLSDLAASRQFAADLRRDIMEISQTTDVETVKERSGQLTNFSTRILYKSELEKVDVKRILYGDLLLDVNYRIMRLYGYTPEQADPGAIVWGEPLPENEQEQVTALQSELNMGIISKQTAAQERGRDWELEQERMTDEKSAAEQNSTNIGGQILRNFIAGRGVPTQTRQPAPAQIEG